MDKDTLRKEMREKLRAMTSEEKATESLVLEQAVISSEEFKNSSSVYLFSPLKNEPATEMIFNAALTSGKKVAYPLCEGDNMSFYFVNSLDNLKPGAFGILEPDKTICSLAEPLPGEKSFILIPGLAFDSFGGRLGRGKGYYDRYLSSHKFTYYKGHFFACQAVEKVPLNEFDFIIL